MTQKQLYTLTIIQLLIATAACVLTVHWFGWKMLLVIWLFNAAVTIERELRNEN